jgi:leucyl-tRNA synthetase
LAGYGTGAVMAVPAHDERDFEFANKYSLSIRQVIKPQDSFKSVVIAVTLTDDVQFKKELTENGINFELAVSTISNREHIRVYFKEENLKDFITLVQKYITEKNWVEVLGTENLVIQKDNVYNNFLDDAGNWFDKFSEWEPNVKGQKSLWDMLAKNPFLHDYVCYTDSGLLRNSNLFNDMSSNEAKQKITKKVLGKVVKQYRLRDWGISRQRYWGVPIPIVYDPQGVAHVIPQEHLPWLLPTDVDHTPDGTAPLARSKELFERTERIFGAGWKPEVETMDTFVDSSWYFYRYLDPKNENEFCSKEKMEQWLPINLYMGGAEHTTMHVLYSRFWTKALHDLGLVNNSEEFTIRKNRGLILGPDGDKMSKSKGNVIDPDEIVERLGADTVRMYLAFMGPYGVTVNYPWDPNGVVGVRRFLERTWRFVTNNAAKNEAFLGSSGRPAGLNQTSSSGLFSPALLHKSIKKITEDIDAQKYNTAISQMMICLNEFEKSDSVSVSDIKIFLQLLAPFAPHMTEELWYMLGGTESIHTSDWPKYDESKIIDTEFTIAVQVNGKVRDEIVIGADVGDEEVKNMALASEKVQKWINADGGSGEVKKIIYIKNKIVSINV